jgi:hypothetical protein
MTPVVTVRLTIPGVVEELRRHGINMETLPGEYRLNYRTGPKGADLYADDLAKALDTGLAMAAHRAANPLPVSTVSRMRRINRRAFIRRHNAKVAARHAARARKAAEGRETTNEEGRADERQHIKPTTP